eukprot:TRINITY_DN14621_c0_g1_i1.p1 TRINITY_DN14621_c0_g1~~TRINITY_DN14621_c0_g1_i1.p1  ORF type:complete len:149 (+),score=44.27 TRINITY_DN14621_c0_g1_i1:39-485(+)
MSEEPVFEHPIPDEDKAATAWMKDQLEQEIARLKGLNQRIIPLPVKNTGIIVQQPQSRKQKVTIVNRVEFGTAFDFRKVQQILLQNPIPCPSKPTYLFQHVVLLSDAPLPMIFGYLYEKNPKNSLEDWRFVNSQGDQCSHHWDLNNKE